MKEILVITSAVRGLDAVYGFGSFFRRTTYADIDILAVANPTNTDTLKTYYDLQTALFDPACRLGIDFHVTLLTHVEFEQRPLRDMKEIYLLSGGSLDSDREVRQLMLYLGWRY